MSINKAMEHLQVAKNEITTAREHTEPSLEDEMLDQMELDISAMLIMLNMHSAKEPIRIPFDRRPTGDAGREGDV